MEEINDVAYLGSQFEWLEANLGLVAGSGNRDGVLDIECDWRILSANTEVFETESKVVVGLVR